jgi:hypothetical protein
MKPVQPLLIVGSAMVLLVYLGYFRTKLLDRLLGLALLAAAWFAILLPEDTTRLANLLGVGRGADLIFYLFGLFTVLALVILSTQTRTASLQITALVRQQAIRDAIAPSEQAISAREGLAPSPRVGAQPK